MDDGTLSSQPTVAGRPMPRLYGGRLPLDFVNSIEWRHASRDRGEYLLDYPGLLAWAVHVGVLDHERADVLGRRAVARPREADAVLARVVAVREALYGLVAAAALGRPAAEEDVEVVNAAVTEAAVRARLVPDGGRYASTWPDEDDLAAPLWPLARAAGELLTSSELELVRQCDNESCDWLFLDTSRGRRRRWCSMTGCGNKAKARRHYARTREAAS